MTSRSPALSQRLATLVEALPLRSDHRVLEIGCGPGAAARAVASRLDTGVIVAIDRSAKAVAQARAGASEEIASGRMEVRQSAIENFELAPEDEPFDLVFAARVGALDGRHPEAGKEAMKRIAAVTAEDAKLFVDGVEVAIRA